MALDYDPKKAVAHLRKADPRLAELIKQAGPFTVQPEKIGNPFAALFRSIVYQQLSGKAAGTIHRRAVEALPGKRVRPQAVLAVSGETLRGAGMSRAKTAAVKDLAQKSLDGIVPTMAKLRKLEDEAIIERLTQVRGIGRWTVEMLLMFWMGRPDVLPVSDLGVRQGFQITYRKRKLPDAKVMQRHAEKWRPYRSVASWYMWRAVDIKRGTLIPR